VLVLSTNDHCVVVGSSEIKALGVKVHIDQSTFVFELMGEPELQP
jgi:hypothetical protein